MQDLHRDALERAERVKLDEVLVELSTDSPDEAFEADGLNVGPGGLALRSPLLPEVGSRMRCRFASPFDGTTIHADCEVVWASDQGPNLGEFGLRFERLSGESAEALRRLVELEDRVLTADEAADLGWSAPPVVGPVTIALTLDGVGSELVAEVAHDADDVLVAEQELPFLRLGTGITTEDGRRGVLQSVELRIDGELPRLVLTVDYDAPAEPVRTDAGEEAAEVAASERAGLVLDPETDEDADLRVTTPYLAATEADQGDHDTIPDGRPLHEPEQVKMAASVEWTPREASVGRPRIRVREVGEPVLAKANAVASAVKDATHDRLSSALPVVRDGIDQARESVTLVASRGAEQVTETVGVLVTRLRRFVKVLRSRQAASVEEPAAKARRVQRRPGERVVEEKPAVDPQRALRGRHLVLGAFGLLVVGLAVRGILHAPDEAAAPSAPQTQATSEPVDLGVNGAPAQDGAPPPVTAQPVPAQALPAAADAPPPTPTVGAPAYGAGPIPTPTYPSLDRGATVEAGTAPAPTTPPARNFGAASVPGATPFELLMTTPIERIEGQATESGFTVQITRSNSLTRASPIAAQHPDVDRASVTNVGENATLRIDFKPGRRPAYRVEANGNRLRILLGR